nr:PREDICTED: aromatic peroxygenase-like [Bemisia tabaci]
MLFLINDRVAASMDIIQELKAKLEPSRRKRQLPIIAPGFDPALQRIDVSGLHEFVPPGPGDQRGPCPGLNALANHNYLPHNGVATIRQFTEATNKVFGMGLDISLFLSVYGAIFDGNLEKWSIGGPSDEVKLAAFLSQPQGISYSHNHYEGNSLYKDSKIGALKKKYC